jgi:hypothetical protein
MPFLHFCADSQVELPLGFESRTLSTFTHGP